MPKPNNNALRIAIPLLVFAFMLGVTAVVSPRACAQTNNNNNNPQTDTAADTQTNTTDTTTTTTQSTIDNPTTPAGQSDAAEQAIGEPADQAADPDNTPSAQSQPSADVQQATITYKAARFDVDPDTPYDTLGSIDPSDAPGDHRMLVRFSPFGAGLEELTLANHFESIRKEQHITLQRFFPRTDEPLLGSAPFAIERVIINDQPVLLSRVPIGDALWKRDPLTQRVTPQPVDPAQSFWQQTAPGSFRARITDQDDRPVLEILRTYTLDPNSYVIKLRQSLNNLSGTTLNVQIVHLGPTELPIPTVRYGGDVRRLRFGFLPDPKNAPASSVRAPTERPFFLQHRGFWFLTSGLIDEQYDNTPLWPNEESQTRNLSLAWAALTARHFTVAIHAPHETAAAPVQPLADFPRITRFKTTTFKDFVFRTPPTQDTPPSQDTPAAKDTSEQDDDQNAQPQPPAPATPRELDQIVTLALDPGVLTLEPAGSANDSRTLDLDIYAGPLSTQFINDQPSSAAAQLDSVVVYTFGGPCAFCTFQSLTYPLRSLLDVFHMLWQDWALSILTLLFCVRLLLHPVTRWSQIRLHRFGKQMQGVAPKMKAIQDKYKDDREKLTEEIRRLHREEGVQYSGALGCLPMFLQSPVWIALYAMLFFNFELRQQPAFYALFQNISDILGFQTWSFLADLSEPDKFITLPFSFELPLMGNIEALNILPFLLATVFYIQQKYITPPTNATTNPEAEQAQKISRVLMVVLFPLIMYNAPSGLALYFVANSTLAIIESRNIRKHAERLWEQQQNNTDPAQSEPKKKDPAKPGFMTKLRKRYEELQKRAEEMQKLREQMKQQQAKGAAQGTPTSRQKGSTRTQPRGKKRR